MSAPEPFASVADAWFWTMAALVARRDGYRGGASATRRACEPDDVVKVLDRLYRRRVVELTHARVLRIYGEQGRAPRPTTGDARLWNEAMHALEAPLRLKGIVR